MHSAQRGASGGQGGSWDGFLGTDNGAGSMGLTSGLLPTYVLGYLNTCALQYTKSLTDRHNPVFYTLERGSVFH